MSSRSNPRRPYIVLDMVRKQAQRYRLSGQWEDLDKLICHLTESILLPPPQHGPSILHALYFLASALHLRSRAFKYTEDAIYATKYLFHLRVQPHDISDVPRHEIATFLMDTLAWQVELEAGNAMQNIRDMAVLCHELLTSDTSDVDAARIVHLIYMVVVSKIRTDVLDQPLDNLIKCLRVARTLRPDLLKGRLALAISLLAQYSLAYANDDYEEAVSILDDIIASSFPGDSQDEFFPVAQGLATLFVTSLAMIRSRAHDTPEYLEEEIYHTRAFLASSSVEEFRPYFGVDLEDTAKQRFLYFGSIDGVETLPAKSQLHQPKLPRAEVLQKAKKMERLLFGIRNTDDTTKINEAIEKGRSILASYFPTDPLSTVSRNETRDKRCLFDLFGQILFEAFKQTGKIEYLNESIRAHRQLLGDPFPQNLRVFAIPNLTRPLLARFTFFPGYRAQDLNEALELLPQCINDAHFSFPNRCQFACVWAHFARLTRHPSVHTAYKTAMSLLQDNLHFAPTLQLQHTTLATHDLTHRMPLDYASHQVDLGQLKEAIETLERGRALLWSEMRHFHTSINQLLETDPDLGHKFAALNRELEEITKSVPPSHKLSMDDGVDDDLKAVDPFGRLLLKQRGLLKERGMLISQIQTLPGFDDFLAFPSFDTLHSAASSGSVIIINHSMWRSDILILLHNASPSLIPTPPDFYCVADALKVELLDSRRQYGLDSQQYEETLAWVLKELYNLVGKPVIDRLHQLQVPEQSRIWWCPTSVFVSLPLHAMGPIPSDDSETRYFLDLYICSYTPALSALIQSRTCNSGSQSSNRPSILLVAQPDPSLPTVGMEEIEVVQALDANVTNLISEAATPAAVIDGFHHHRFVHFACHGTLETGKPFEAGFELYGDQRLTILEIVRAHLPAAEFAFLSACHTAEVAEGSVVDEGLHLAAAVQYCGFRSVVGTMWAMADEDGRDLAKHFYKALFSPRRDQGIPLHERSAIALRLAVKKLRRKRGITVERWVNFVHYGA